MPDFTTLAVFAAAALALALVPGPAVLHIVARGVEGGRAAGLASVFGITLGGLVHIAAAIVGLSALLASSAAAFAVVKWLGVAYLVWLGLTRLLGSDRKPDIGETPMTRNLSGIFWQGLIVNVLNPKTALLFLAFVPQFVDPSAGAAWLQILVLGCTFVVIALCTDSLYALLSGTVGGWLRRQSERFRRRGRHVSGLMYLALGAAAATSGSSKN